MLIKSKNLCHVDLSIFNCSEGSITNWSITTRKFVRNWKWRWRGPLFSESPDQSPYYFFHKNHKKCFMGKKFATNFPTYHISHMENFLFMLSLEKVDLRFPFIKIFGPFLCIYFDFRVSSFIFIILFIAIGPTKFTY